MQKSMRIMTITFKTKTKGKNSKMCMFRATKKVQMSFKVKSNLGVAILQSVEKRCNF